MSHLTEAQVVKFMYESDETELQPVGEHLFECDACWQLMVDLISRGVTADSPLGDHD